MKLIFATANAHKADEVRNILAGTDIEVETLLDHPELPEAPETGDTFIANAQEKAEFIHRFTGRPVIADDSGLAVDALDGAPGVHSKRFSPEATHDANNTLLLQKMQGVTDRSARFVCVLFLKTDDFEGHVEGTCEGRIAGQRTGDKGFGYDPVFLPDALEGRSMAEATMEEKNAISHRGHAFRQLKELLRRAGEL